MNKKVASYQRIVLKLTGENWQSKNKIKETSAEIAQLVKDFQIEIAIVVGGGNFIRGAQFNTQDRLLNDRIGMIGTIINALVLENYLAPLVPTRLFSSLPVVSLIEGYSVSLAKAALKMKQVVILAGGTGNPYFSTDTACALRGRELDAELVLKGTKVDGIYSSDPLKDAAAVFYPRLTYEEAIAKRLKVMDETAFYLLKEAKIPLLIYNGLKKGNLTKIIMGKKIGSLVC